MKFRNVEFNDDLMNALRNDNLVVFAGAGVSAGAPANLPSFDGLTQRVGKYFQVSRDDEETVDQFLGRLETQEGRDIRTFIVGQLTSSSPNQLHSDLLDIRPRSAEPKLVTTNFDRLFEATAKGVELRNLAKIYTAPALPPGARFAGIVNIHGAIDQPDDMVLTDSDIGRAYLEERWALEFLQGLFRTRHVLFVGYSHQDPIIRYLARAMPTGNRPAQRFILTHQPAAQVQGWSSLGIKPILYQRGEDGNHHQAAEAIAELAEYQRRSPSTWRQLVAQTVSQPTPPVDESSQNIAGRALQDKELTPTFIANAESLDWIEWCLDRGYLAGVFDERPLNATNALLSWVAQLLTAHNPNDSMATIARGGRKLCPQLWWNIAHQTSTRGNQGTAANVQHWVSYLLTASPTDQDRRKPDGLCQLARTCVNHELYTEAATIFEELCRPVITPQQRQPGKQSFNLKTLGEPWALSETWARIKEHPEIVAPRVLEQAVKQIEYRRGILEQWGEANPDNDEDSSGRHLIEESQYNYRANHRASEIDIILDAARDCLEWLTLHHQELLTPWVDRLIDSPAPLARRLAVHTARIRTDQDAGAKIDWLLARNVPLNSRINRETQQLLIEEYKNLDDEHRRLVIAAMTDTEHLGERP